MPVDTPAKEAHALNVTLGRAIKAARGALKQDALAKAVGTDQPTVSKWERGLVRPSLEDISAVEQATLRPRGWVLIAAGLVDGVTTTLAAIEADAALDDRSRQMLRLVYQAAVQ